MSWIRFGFPLAWKGAPPLPHVDVPNWKSADQDSEFVDAFVREMVAAGYVSHTDTIHIGINPLGAVPKPRCSDMRFIVDMRHVHKWIDVPKFMFEGLHNFKNLLFKVDYIFHIIKLTGSATLNFTPRRDGSLAFACGASTTFTT
jgi:hypothetical protein